MPFSPRTLLAVAASFCLALILTPLVRSFARRFGFVAKPKIDRWHKKPTAMLGGLAIWLSVVITSAAFSLRIAYGKQILLASTFLFLVGLVDDLIHIKPYQKLIGQILGSAFLVRPPPRVLPCASPASCCVGPGAPTPSILRPPC